MTIDVDELEKDLRMAGLLRHFKSGIATRLNHEEWAALSSLTNAAPSLLALARAGRRLAEVSDAWLTAPPGKVYDLVCREAMVQALAAWREADA